MKREELEAMGLAKDAIDKIMDLNGADINAAKAPVNQLQAQVETLTGQLQTATDGLKAFEGVDVNSLKEQISKLQSDMQAQKEAFAFDSMLDGAIRDAKGRNVKAIRSLLDIESLKTSKNQAEDIKAQLERCQSENGWAFGSDDAANSGLQTAATGTEHGAGGTVGAEDGVEAAFARLNPHLKID